MQPPSLSLNYQSLSLRPRSSPDGVGANDYKCQKGLAKCQQNLAPMPERVHIPDPVAVAILIIAKTLLEKNQ